MRGHSCFECGTRAGHAHHVIPRVLGGTRTIALCEKCHGKVHGRGAMSSSALIKRGIRRAKELGVTLGRPRTIDRPAIKALRESGASYRQIEKQLGVSQGAIGRAVRP